MMTVLARAGTEQVVERKHVIFKKCILSITNGFIHRINSIWKFQTTLNVAMRVFFNILKDDLKMLENFYFRCSFSIL